MTSKKTPPLKCSEGTVYISNTKGRYIITAKKGKEKYYIGYRKEVNEACEVQKECYEHLKNGDLDEWVANKRKENQKTPPLKCPEGTVYISSSRNSYYIYAKKNGGIYYIERCEEINEAYEAQERCYERLKNGSLDEWIANRHDYNKGFNEKLELLVEYVSEFGDVPSSSQNHPTIYKDVNLSTWWVGQKRQFTTGAMSDWKAEAFRAQGIHMEKYAKKPKTKAKVKKSKVNGVCYSKMEQKWQAFFVKDGKTYLLGSTKNHKEAARLRKEAEKHANDFLEWYKENKKAPGKGKVNKTSKMRGVTYNKPSKKWRATYYFEKKMYYLGGYEKIEDAIRVRKEAEKHADDFLEWHLKWITERSERQKEINSLKSKEKRRKE